MPSIYEIAETYREIIDVIEAEENEFEIEIDDTTLYNAFESIDCEFENKVDSWQWVIKKTENEANELREEVKRLQARIKSKEKKALRMKNILSEIIQRVIEKTGDKNYKTLHNTFYRFGKKLNVFGTVPDEFRKEYVSKVKDDVKIKEALDNGLPLDFAKYENTYSVR